MAAHFLREAVQKGGEGPYLKELMYNTLKAFIEFMEQNEAIQRRLFR